jgi:hypothetical protein
MPTPVKPKELSGKNPRTKKPALRVQEPAFEKVEALD